jgi:hypothetical protein
MSAEHMFFLEIKYSIKTPEASSRNKHKVCNISVYSRTNKRVKKPDQENVKHK